MSALTTKPSGRNVYLDLFKFFLCYMVICIHLVQTAYPIYPLYRLSVPMFFLISGYFLYTPDPEKAKSRAPGFIRRCATYMAVGIAIHTVYEVIAFLVDDISVGWLLTTLFYDDPAKFWFRFFFENAPIPYYTVGAQTWFLIALFTLSLVHYTLARSGKLWWYKWMVPVCFVCYFFFTAGVYFFQPETSVQMRYMRNAWFFGLPCFGLGYLIAGIKWPRGRLAQVIYGGLGAVFFGLQILEDSLWRTPNCKIEMYVSGVIAAVCLLQFFLCIRRAECGLYYKWIGKSAPFYVYILHMVVAVTLSRFVAMENLYLKSLAVFLISFVIYETVYLGQMGVKHLRARKKTA
ncbi:MAG: acyltransferase [Ruminococcaceae bacterium]|nr:acyltransferase [Oscillospiraceae bacterium]